MTLLCFRIVRCQLRHRRLGKTTPLEIGGVFLHHRNRFVPADAGDLRRSRSPRRLVAWRPSISVHETRNSRGTPASLHHLPKWALDLVGPNGWPFFVTRNVGRAASGVASIISRNLGISGMSTGALVFCCVSTKNPSRMCCGPMPITSVRRYPVYRPSANASRALVPMACLDL